MSMTTTTSSTTNTRPSSSPPGKSTSNGNSKDDENRSLVSTSASTNFSHLMSTIPNNSSHQATLFNANLAANLANLRFSLAPYDLRGLTLPTPLDTAFLNAAHQYAAAAAALSTSNSLTSSSSPPPALGLGHGHPLLLYPPPYPFLGLPPPQISQNFDKINSNKSSSIADLRLKAKKHAESLNIA